MIASLFLGAMLFVDPAQLNCPLTSLTEEQRAAFDAYVGDRGPSDDPRFVVFTQAVAACAARNRWPSEAADHATLWQIVTTGTARVRTTLAARGFRVEGVEQAILGDAALMQQLREGELDKSTGDFVRRRGDLFDTFLGAQAVGQRAQVLSDVQDFVAGVGLQQVYRARFAEQ
jgi:hypothetical protein